MEVKFALLTFLTSIIIIPIVTVFGFDGPRGVMMPGNDFCPNEFGNPLDLVFVVDQSSRHIRNAFTKIVNIVEELMEKHPDSRFGITTFADWPASAWNGHGRDEGSHHDDPEGCYKFHLALTSNLAAVKGQSANIPYVSSGSPESSFAALLLTAADKRLGWATSKAVLPDIDSTKVLVLLTDSVYHPDGEGVMGGKDRRHPPKADGSDKCHDIQVPTHAQVRDILRQYNISGVFGLIADVKESSTRGNVLAEWSKAEKILNISYAQLDISLESSHTTVFPHLEKFINKISPPDEYITCEDPPAYNTLGL